MKAVILAGGLGTRLQEETSTRPKPMVEVGGFPMLWHIMKCYEHFGVSEFVVALGYKGDFIKDYFLNYRARSHSMSVCLRSGEVEMHQRDENDQIENWNLHLLDTGASTMTGGRIAKAAKFIGHEAFMVTYGDGVSDVDIAKLLAFHKSHGKLATMTAVRPPSRFGGIGLEGDAITHFEEKPQIGEGWINGGFFVLEPGVMDYIGEDPNCVFEREPLEKLASDGQLMAYRHEGFWQCMDTIRDVQLLESLWQSGQAPWNHQGLR